MKSDFAISIVLFNPDLKKLNFLLKKILKLNSNSKIFLVDNSTSLNKLEYFKSDQIIYIRNKKNVGFGKANNISIKECLKKSIKRLFIINYDIDFKTNVFLEMINFLNNNIDIGLMMPKILNPDGTPQYLPKIQPLYSSIIKRKLYHLTKKFFKKFVINYEGRHLTETMNYNVKNISGCFMLLNLELLGNSGC